MAIGECNHERDLALEQADSLKKKKKNVLGSKANATTGCRIQPCGASL